MTPRISSLLSCILICIFGALRGSAQENAELRWAVIANQDAVAGGIADLLSVSLDSQGFSIIERTQIQELEKELERNISAGRLGPAMELGKRLGAQRVVVCQDRFAPRSNDRPLANLPTNSTPPKSLKIIVCDSTTVARIGVAEFEYSDTANLIDNIVFYLKSESFGASAKIESVIGIPPFACKNLGDDFSDLGQQAHDLLSSQILAVPGIALIEWDAARELTREIESTVGIEKRRIPYVVEVDYRVIPQDKESVPQVEVARRVLSVGQPFEEKATIRLSEFEPWLRSKILPELLAWRSKSDTLNKDEQLHILRTRAQAMQRLGIPLLTAQIREVILQIAPNDSIERLRLIDDYGQISRVTDLRRRLSLFPLFAHELQARSFEREHFEYVVQNGQISFPDAIERFQTLILAPDSDIALSRISPKFALSPLDLERTLASLDQDDHFVRTVGPAILKQRRRGERSAEEELKLNLAWTNAVLSAARINTWFHFGSEDSRLMAIRLIADIVPEDFPTVGTAAWIFGTSTFPKKTVQVAPDFRNGHYTPLRFEVGSWPEEVHDFHSKYLGITHRHIQLYLQLSQLQFRFAEPMQLHTSFPNGPSSVSRPIGELESELVQLQQLAKQTVGAETQGLTGPNQFFFDYVFDITTKYAQEIKRRTEGKPLPANPNVTVTEPGFGRLRFHATDLTPPPLEAFSARWQPDGPDHDLVYDHKRVYRLDRDGIFQLISPEAGYSFFDEEFVWSVSQLEHGGSRVSIVDRNGRFVAFDDSVLLPQYEKFKAYGTGRGQGIIIGWFEGGTWCGSIAYRDNRFDFRVFHEARDYYRPSIPNEVERASRSIDTRFEPSWNAIGRDAKGDLLLVGRLGLYPLRIDLATHETSVMPLTNTYFSQDAIIAGNKFYNSQYSFVFEYDLDSTASPIPSTMIVGTDHMEHVRLGNATAGSYQGTMILDGDWMLFPGQTWYRYHRITKQTERLVPTSLPRPYQHGSYGKSSIHGIVLRSPQTESAPEVVYRVEIVP